MRIPFAKMHGLGNDFVVIDGRETAFPPMTTAAARAIADRRRGVGCDQVIVLERSDKDGLDFRMRIFNSDGGEVEACGNAARAVALLHGRPARIETGGGQIELMPGDGQASVDMGKPRFGWETIPLAYAMDTSALPLGWGELENPMAVNVGNPHVVFFVDDVDAVDLAMLGPEIERDAVFPQGINVNVAQVLGRDRMMLRVWERGAGLTRACGTGACASAVAAIRKGFVDNIVTVGLPGGDLSIEWPGSPRGECERITMTGPAAESFRGTFLWEDFA